jgi:hypothetical protein
MGSKFMLTSHAVEQLVTRYDRTLSHEDAKLLLETAITENILRLTERTLSGEDQWHLPGLGIVLITKRRKDKNIIVTVVPAEKVNSVREQKRADALVLNVPDQLTAVTKDGFVNIAIFEVHLHYTTTLNDNQLAQSMVLEHTQSRLIPLINDTNQAKHVQIKDVAVRVK